MLSKIAKLLPVSTRSHVAMLVEQGGVELEPDDYVGGAIALAVIAGVAAAALAGSLGGLLASVVAALAAIGAIAMLSEVYLLSRADHRAGKIEELLADALQLIAANIRAGMTLENAIWTAARPEFGPLSEEIKKVSSDALGGKPVREALLAMPNRVRSPLVKRAVKLAVEGIRLGGEMAPLLDAVARDVQTQQMLRREVVSSTTTYAIFIVFAAVFISPVLFAVSVFYGEVNERITQRVQPTGELSSGGGLPFSGFRGGATGRNSLPVKDLSLFATMAVAITAALSGLILGAIRTGRVLPGLSLAPLFTIVSIAIFFAALQGIRIALSGLTS